jgi:hypothetical protein
LTDLYQQRHFRLVGRYGGIKEEADVRPLVDRLNFTPIIGYLFATSNVLNFYFYQIFSKDFI